MAKTVFFCNSIADKKDKRYLTFLCSFAYFCSYMTRVNYKTVISAIMESEGLTKEVASIALTGLFITYGLGQLISGWLGDIINPKYLMCGGLLLAACMNVALPWCSGNITLMTVIWCINGFGQAMMWPPIVKTLTNFMSTDDYLHASVKVSWGSSFATIFLYLICPAIISFMGGYQPVFYFCAAFGIIGAAVLFVSITKLERKYPNAGKVLSEAEGSGSTIEAGSAKAAPKMPSGIYGFFAILLLAIIIQGALRDGVDAWMPSYVNDTFNLGTSASILTGIILPIFTIISYQIATAVYEKFIRNEMSCSGFFFITSGLSSAALLLLRAFGGSGSGFGFTTVLSILLFAFIVGSMHAINLLVTCFIPRRFRKFGNISWISGLTNFATYVGSAASTYGFALITDKFDWNGTIISWIVIAAAGVAVCAWGFFPWRRFVNKIKE